MPGFGDGLRVLVIDDDPAVSAVLKIVLKEEGFDVVAVGDLRSAHQSLETDRFDLAMVDHNLPDGTGLEIVRHILTRGLDTEMIVMTADARVETVVEAMQLGARDFVVKPFDSIEALKIRLNRAVDMLVLRRQNRDLVHALTERNRELEALAVRDPLTKLYNHAFLQESLEREVQRARRHDHELGLLFIDLDRFKLVNDSYGHPAGDTLLRTFGQILTGVARMGDMNFRLRAQDITARYGGDEFAIIMPETPKAGALFKAESLRAFVDQYDYTSLGLPRQTVSIGAAVFPHHAGDRASLIDAADRALYEAKRAGRNRVETARPDGRAA